MSIFTFHEIYVQVKTNLISAKDLRTGRINVVKIDPTDNLSNHDFDSILSCIVETVRNGSSFSLLKRRVILHWQIDWPIKAQDIGPTIFRECDAKSFLLCTDKDGSLEEILKLAPWRHGK